MRVKFCENKVYIVIGCIVITMGCNVVCPKIPNAKTEDWGLDDPTGKEDTEFIKVIRIIEENIKCEFLD